MYQKILVTLEGTPTDRAIIDHIKQLARQLNSQVILLHVVASATAHWSGSDAGGQEVALAQDYLQEMQAELTAAGISATTDLAFGDPVTEIIKRVPTSGCDLVAMSTHGHRLVGDLLHGVTASRVQHSTSVPVLLLRAKP